MAEAVFPEVIAPSPAAALPAGACFGFGVFSTLSFRYLRDGDGEPLWVEAPSDEEPSPGRLGKTTLAAALFREGYRVLSEDLSCLRLRPFPQVIPGPAMLRVRRDVADRLKLCGLQAVAGSGNRISFTIAKPRRGDCRPVRLRAVVFLKPAHDGIATERVRATDAIPDLWTLSFHMPTDEDRRRRFRGVPAPAGA